MRKNKGKKNYILDIDTSDRKKVIVSLKLDGQIIAKSENENTFSSQALLPSIVKLLKKRKIHWKEIREIKVKEGPGSYTGLRVGITVAKTIAWILGIPINGKNPEEIKPIYKDS